MTAPRTDEVPLWNIANILTMVRCAMVPLLVVLAVLAALLMLFVADNFVLTEIRFFNRGIQVRLAWAMIIPLALGLSIGWLWGRFRR